MKREWLVWSFKHDAWWGAVNCGYVRNVLNAGIYTKDEAAEIVARSNYAPEIKNAEARHVSAFTDEIPRKLILNTVLCGAHGWAMSQPARPAEVAALNDAIAAKPTATLIDAARRLVEARAKVEQASLIYRAKVAEFTERYAWLAEDKKSAEALVAAAEADVRSLARAHYDATQDKTPMKGVTVKEFDVLVYDPKIAFAWAQEKKMALVPESLDVKAFEKIAGATPLPFVTKKKEPQVQIGKMIEVPDLPPATTDVELDEILGGVE